MSDFDQIGPLPAGHVTPLAPVTPPAPPALKPLTLNSMALEAIAHTREAALFMHSATERLLEVAVAQNTPPEIRPVTFSQAQPVVTDKSQWEPLSIGFINPNSIRIFLGLSGSATALGRGIAIPPNNIMVLPVRDYDLELGVDPSDQAALAGGNTAVLYVMRFHSVQPTFMGKGA